MTTHEIEPPWVKYPGFPPGDSFWRQPGEAWFFYIWLPYWQSLSSAAKDQYLTRWSIPDEWSKYCEHINPEFKRFLESSDDDD